MSGIIGVYYSLKSFVSNIAGWNSFLRAILFVSCLAYLACLPTREGGTGTINIDGFILSEFEFENARFELREKLPDPIPRIQQAHTIWLKSGDKVIPKTDSFEWHWSREGAMCDFGNTNSDCQICNFCNLPPDTSGPPCFGVSPVFPTPLMTIVSHEGFDPNTSPTTIRALDGPSLMGTCGSTNPAAAPPVFEPKSSGLYRFSLNPAQAIRITSETNAEANIRIVSPGEDGARPAAYKLSRQIIEGREYWTWSVLGDPVWLDNFSPNLNLTRIRVLKGRCEDDPVLGGDFCRVPDDAEVIKPSRLLFLPLFMGSVSQHPLEGSNRCYSIPDLNVLNGSFIDLSLCRDRYHLPRPGDVRVNIKDVTPTYDPAAPGEMVNNVFLQWHKLTWLVEFNTEESADTDLSSMCDTASPFTGCDAPGNNEDLIIEFTIKAK